MNFREIPKTWKRRIQGAGLTITEFCELLSIQPVTIRSKNPTLFTVDKIENALRSIEEKNKND